MPSNPTSFPYCFIFVAWLIELGKKMVIVRARVVSSQTRFSPTMTLYSTMILGYCRIQLKKWQTCHQVPRCWPHSTVCWSPGHGIGRPGLMVTSHITDRISGTWATSLMLHNRRRRNFRFWNGCDAIQDGGGKRKLRLRLLWSIKLVAYTTNIGSAIGLVPDGTKQLLGPIFTHNQMCFVVIVRAIWQELWEQFDKKCSWSN